MAGPCLRTVAGVRGAPAGGGVGRQLFAVREPIRELAALPELVVEGLEDADARQLLTSVVSGRLDQRVADQLVAEASGNPLALLELPRGLTPAELAGGFGLPEARPPMERIEDRFLERLEELRADSRQLLLVAAIDATGDSALARRAAARLGLTDAAFESLASTDLIEIGARVPVPPSARAGLPFYRAAAPDQRRRVRAALADATDPRVDPDRRAGISPRRRQAPTSPLPASSNKPPAAPRRAAAWPPPPPSSSAPRR